VGVTSILRGVLQDHEFLKIDPKEKRLVATVNFFNTDMKDHRQDQQLLLLLNGPI
jgi:hypothetical protein